MREECAIVETTATGQLNEVDRPLFAVYEQPDQSLVLSWVPILLGLLALAIAALALCPIPRSQTLSPGRALFLAVVYVVATVGISVSVLVTGGIVTGGIVLGWRRLEAFFWQVLPHFCSVAAWITPVVAFYRRDSLWAVPAASLLSVFGCRLIDRYYLAVGAREMFPGVTEPQISQFSHPKRLLWLTLAALLLQIGALSIVASRAHPATLLIGSAIIVIYFSRDAELLSHQSQSRSRFAQTLGLGINLCLVIILVGGSLTPYLLVPTEDTTLGDAGANMGRSRPKPTGRSTKPKASSVASAGLRKLLGLNPKPSFEEGDVGETPTHRPYPVLQTLFGEGVMASGEESRLARKKLYKGQSTALVPADSYPGMILRPETKDLAPTLPPLARRRVFDERPDQQSEEPLSIPFYGAYWFFRTSDENLPPDAIEAHGDPASRSFKTTDYSPISMEAHQNFGSLIKLSCCKAIELVISNGDRRPGTVAVELVLTNTTLPGKPHQSLGIAPVNSTLHWFPGDNRAPVTEVLTFRVPANPAIPGFDEASIHFELRSPRERWSAQIAIEKFRLIPRGL